MQHQSSIIPSFTFQPTIDSSAATSSLATLISPCINGGLPSEDSFFNSIETLQQLFHSYCRYCSPPWCASRLAVDEEAKKQSELWLPLECIRPIFYRFLRSCLTYQPVFSSTPFAIFSSWFEIVASFPSWLAPYANPAQLLIRLHKDTAFRHKFIFWIFMPRRYYGSGSNRYPLQMNLLTAWLQKKLLHNSAIKCLDAVSGDGSSVYQCAKMILEAGFETDNFKLEGWALDPLESWAAAHRILYHDPCREIRYCQESEAVFRAKAERSLVFKNYNLLTQLYNDTEQSQFDLIFCNGLLGGPIINSTHTIHHIVTLLCKFLAPGGLLLAGNHFHGGWKKQCTEIELKNIFAACGLQVSSFGEGISGKKKGIL